MTTSAWIRALPPFLLGAGLAVISVVSAGLLLYGGPGFIQALSVVLATLFGALAAGVAAPRRVRGGRGGDPVEALRRRWLLTLVAFTLAAFFSAGWEGFRGFGARAVTQGVGLALLGALPLFAGGTVLGTLARIPTGGRGPAPAALAGAAVGSLVLGFVLFPVLSPTAILLCCLVVLSGGALIQGWALEEITWTRVEARRAGDEGSARVERWVRGKPRLDRAAFIEDGRLRVVAARDGGPAGAFDHAVVQGLDAWSRPGARSLVLGAGGAVVARELLERAGRAGKGEIVFVEGNAALAEALRHTPLDGGPPLLAAASADGKSRLESRAMTVSEVLTGSPAHLPPAAFDLVFVDTLALAPDPASFRFPPGALLRLRASLRPGGVLVAGPLQDGGGAGPLLDHFRPLSTHFSRVSLYVAGRGGEEEAAREVPRDRLEMWRRTRVGPESRPAILVAGVQEAPGAAPLPAWPDRVSSHLRVRLDERVAP